MQFSIILKSIFLLALILTLVTGAFGQQKKLKRADSNQTKPDTDYWTPRIKKPGKEKIYHPDSTHKPLSAVIKSALIPGWGQFYNNRWWKVPVIYGGLSSLTIALAYNDRNYERYLRIYHYYKNPAKVSPKSPDYVYYHKLVSFGYTQAQIADVTGDFDKDFQLCILGIAGTWATDSRCLHRC